MWFFLAYFLLNHDAYYRCNAWENTSPGKPGVGVNPYGIREYNDGDDLRHLHWPSFAKVGKWMTKEFEMERQTKITLNLLVDGTLPQGPGSL